MLPSHAHTGALAVSHPGSIVDLLDTAHKLRNMVTISLAHIVRLETYGDNGTFGPRDAILLGFSGETEQAWNMFHACSDTPGKPSTLTFSLVLRSSMCYS